MSAALQKYLVFGVLFGGWLAADLWTKRWADRSLADPFHPVPVRMTEADAGKPLVAVLGARMGLSEDEVVSRIGPHLRLLEAPLAMDPHAKVFSAEAPAAVVPGFYVFWRDDADLPPRRVDKYERSLISQWAQIGAPDVAPAEIQRVVRGHLEQIDLTGWLTKRIRTLDEEDVQAIAERRMHAVGVPRVGIERKVAAGEIYLVERYHIDVMGDPTSKGGAWFKLLYAENPGAAFGFLRNLDPQWRQIVFTLLTMVAFVVIGGITYRLPPQARLVNVALAGILAGAVGNFVDRLRFGYVVDFIDMDLHFMHWPTYNVADIGITVGVVLLVADMLFNKESPLAKPKKPQAAEGAKA
jgi:signal peptidase II